MFERLRLRKVEHRRTPEIVPIEPRMQGVEGIGHYLISAKEKIKKLQSPDKKDLAYTQAAITYGVVGDEEQSREFASKVIGIEQKRQLFLAGIDHGLVFLGEHINPYDEPHDPDPGEFNFRLQLISRGYDISHNYKRATEIAEPTHEAKSATVVALVESKDPYLLSEASKIFDTLNMHDGVEDYTRAFAALFPSRFAVPTRDHKRIVKDNNIVGSLRLRITFPQPQLTDSTLQLAEAGDKKVKKAVKKVLKKIGPTSDRSIAFAKYGLGDFLDGVGAKCQLYHEPALLSVNLDTVLDPRYKRFDLAADAINYNSHHTARKNDFKTPIDATLHLILSELILAQALAADGYIKQKAPLLRGWESREMEGSSFDAYTKVVDAVTFEKERRREKETSGINVLSPTTIFEEPKDNGINVSITSAREYAATITDPFWRLRALTEFVKADISVDTKEIKSALDECISYQCSGQKINLHPMILTMDRKDLDELIELCVPYRSTLTEDVHEKRSWYDAEQNVAEEE